MADVTRRRRMAWVAAVRRSTITFEHTPPHMYVCSKHFHKGKPAYEMLECDPDWAPSLNLGHTEVKAVDTARFNRLCKRVKKSNRLSTAPPLTSTGAAPLAAEPDNTVPEAEVEEIFEDEEQQECRLCSQRLQEIALLQKRTEI